LIDSHCACSFQIKALIIENTFTSIANMAAKMFPLLSSFLKLMGPGKPLSFLLRNKWDNIGKIENISVPLLMLASTQDEMVPFAHMKSLYEAQKAPVCVWNQFHAHHMTAYEECRQEYWTAIKTFFDEHIDNSDN